MKCILILAAFLALLCGPALASEETSGATAQPTKTGCCPFGITWNARVDSNWAATHTKLLAPTAGELYDAGTSLRNVRNYLAYSFIASVGGGLAGLIASSQHNPHSSSQNGAYYAFTTVASALGFVSAVYLVRTWLETGSAGDRLHNAALGWAKAGATDGAAKTDSER
ncbi:hypothetical protein JXD38_03715 [candidate division WOR-3 bacterium]|nr:hypothetical protein [candidate division WOR-3 bacterium]